MLQVFYFYTGLFLALWQCIQVYLPIVTPHFTGKPITIQSGFSVVEKIEFLRRLSTKQKNKTYPRLVPAPQLITPLIQLPMPTKLDNVKFRIFHI